MYLKQIIQFHIGKCGNEPDIVAALVRTGMSLGAAQAAISMALSAGDIVRVPCRCRNADSQ